MSNVGIMIVKKLAVKFKENEYLFVDGSEVFACHRDLWKAESENQNLRHVSQRSLKYLICIFENQTNLCFTIFRITHLFKTL